MMNWQEHSEWERDWWGDCLNTYGEETKQLDYAKKMGLRVLHDVKGPFIDLQRRSVLDIGGGPVSLLLKCRNRDRVTVIDPCAYPHWVAVRYGEAGIEYFTEKAEIIRLGVYDEVWVYNVLQHVENPASVVSNARSMARVIRAFDWLEISGPGHPHCLLEEQLNQWYGGEGKVVIGNGGKEWFGIFKGDHYAD